MRHSSRRSWSVVLAGGEGERTRPFIERWLGRHRPKQYCTFVGTRSLLQHTIDRADRISRPDRRVTVVARGHRQDAQSQLGGRGRVVFQPANRGTAPGVFLPLTFVRAADPDATVVIYPSDHFVWPESRFVRAIARAISESEACPERPILLGVTPDRPETDYGWIVAEPPNADAPPDTVAPDDGLQGEAWRAGSRDADGGGRSLEHPDHRRSRRDALADGAPLGTRRDRALRRAARAHQVPPRRCRARRPSTPTCPSAISPPACCSQPPRSWRPTN